MNKHGVEFLCLHQKNQNSKPRKSWHRFYNISEAIDYIKNLNKYSKILEIYTIGVNSKNKVYYRNKTTLEELINAL